MRIGLLGASRIAPTAIIDPAKTLPGAFVCAVAARDASKAEAFAQLHAIPQVFESYAALIASPDIDLVYNGLPINLHADWSTHALEAGKHVLCEKPFAMNGAEARAMQAAALASGKRIIEAFHYRYHPGFATMLGWIDTGRIGAVISIDAVFNVPIPDDATEIRRLPETGGGAMMDLGCYPLHWVLSVIRQAPVSLTARAELSRNGVDERMTADLMFAGGATAHIASSMALNESIVARLEVNGEAGRIEFINPLAPQFGALLTITDARGKETADVSRTPTYVMQLERVLDGLAAQKPVLTEGSAVLLQQDTLDAVYAAAGLAHLRAGVA